MQAVEPAAAGALCIFEFFYLARPDTLLAGIEVHGARVRMGERLAREAPVDADLVLPIPDSGTPAAIGFSRATGIPFSEGLIKNRYVGRTFIQPDQELRRQGIRLKFNPLAEVAGKRVVVVDDSIVRGNTTQQIVQMLFDAGATEVHVRISSPPVIGQCFYGIDLADPDEMIAQQQDGRGDPRVHRRDVARVHLARRPRRGDAPPGVGALPRVPHARLPDRGAAGAREAPVRAHRWLTSSRRCSAKRSTTRTSSASSSSARAARGRSSTTQSDWDVFVVVREHRGERPFAHGGPLETVELTLDELRNQPDWNRYSLAWLEPQLDKTGEVAAALRDAVRVDPASAGRAARRIREHAYYRSLKNAKLGLSSRRCSTRRSPSRGTSSSSSPSTAACVRSTSGSSGSSRTIRSPSAWTWTASSGSPARATSASRRALFRDAEALARERGLGAVIDGWEPDVGRLRGE